MDEAGEASDVWVVVAWLRVGEKGSYPGTDVGALGVCVETATLPNIPIKSCVTPPVVDVGTLPPFGGAEVLVDDIPNKSWSAAMCVVIWGVF